MNGQDDNPMGWGGNPDVVHSAEGIEVVELEASAPLPPHPNEVITYLDAEKAFLASNPKRKR